MQSNARLAVVAASQLVSAVVSIGSLAAARATCRRTGACLSDPPPMLCHIKDRDEQQPDTFMTSSGGNRRTTLQDVVNTPVGDALQAPLFDLNILDGSQRLVLSRSLAYSVFADDGRVHFKRRISVPLISEEGADDVHPAADGSLDFFHGSQSRIHFCQVQDPELS